MRRVWSNPAVSDRLNLVLHCKRRLQPLPASHRGRHKAKVKLGPTESFGHKAKVNLALPDRLVGTRFLLR